MAWAVERRLDYIDWRLLTQGNLRRSDLIQTFGISLPQASTDISEFQALYPGAMAYDTSGKKYEPAETPYRSRRGMTRGVLWAIRMLHACGHPMGWRP